MTDDVSGNRLSAWYDLFSRGARDWLRHNEKVRDAVRAHLPQVVAGADVLTRGHSTVRVPVRMLEHYRFRLRSPDQVEGVGQGAAKPGDRIETGGDPAQGGGRGTGGDEDGGIQYTLEFQVDDIVDWLWEEMQLPNLENRAGAARDDDWTREGWDRRGVRSRLDRRRSLKESLKRQAVAPGESPPFTDEDLRYRQLARREQPATQAVVFLVLDVSASMGEEHRKLAKSFFFWAVQGLRRQYRHLEVVFIAHTTEAWEFAEEEFFRVTGSGGTFMSSALTLTSGIVQERFSPSQYNLYFFYASDGENSPSDAAATDTALKELLGNLQFCGFLEVGSGGEGGPSSDIGRLFLQLAGDGRPAAAYRAAKSDDIWGAVRHFFGREQAGAA
jgi:uncharacterized sporulation protein YeaH/YhbH (DUF444 family)